MSRLFDILKLPLNLFLRNKKKSHRKYYYHMLLTNFKDTEGYSLLLGNLQYKEKINTPVPIALVDDIPLHKLTRKQVFSKLGAPKFTTQTSIGGEILDLMVFKMFFFNLKSKLVVLAKGEEILFYCYVFTLLEPMEKKNIFSMLENKYYTGKELDDKKEVLLDSHGTSLSIFDDVYFFVSVSDARILKIL